MLEQICLGKKLLINGKESTIYTAMLVEYSDNASSQSPIDGKPAHPFAFILVNLYLKVLYVRFFSRGSTGFNILDLPVFSIPADL